MSSLARNGYCHDKYGGIGPDWTLFAIKNGSNYVILIISSFDDLVIFICQLCCCMTNAELRNMKEKDIVNPTLSNVCGDMSRGGGVGVEGGNRVRL